MLRKQFEENRARLAGSTRLTADIRLPELTAERFVDLYPLLPYQIDFIIQVVSGLRTQGGASKHVGGANRTIIKLAQQLLINPAVNLADQPVGQLARIDQIYDLVETNIDGEVRGKIAAIASKVDHPAGAVGLQGGLPAAVRQERPPDGREHRRGSPRSRRCRLAAPRGQRGARRAGQGPPVRLGDDGYRIPSPAEDDWEIQRAKIGVKSGDIQRIHAETIASSGSRSRATHSVGSRFSRRGFT